MRNSVTSFLYETVQKFPDRVCVADPREELTFAEFFFRASALADVLKQGGTTNAPVLIYLEKGTWALVSLAAALLSGHFYVPLDLQSPLRRKRAILENLAPSWVISREQHQEELRQLSVAEERLIFLEEVDWGRTPEPLADLVARNRQTTDRIIDTDPCYVIYTSGSTGVPKGVVIPHRGVVDYIEWAIPCLQVDQEEVIGNQAPLFFDNSTLDIYLSWATGARLELLPEELFLFPIKLIEYLEERQISFIFFVPSVLVNIAQMNVLKPGRLPALRKVIFAGEVMPTRPLAYWQKNLPDRLYVNLYGPTEITVDCTYFIVDRPYEAHESLPIGFPCHNTGILILTDEDRPAGVNEPGELCVRGSSLALGYWNEAERSQAVFVQNPLQKNYFDRIYRTGDIVYRNERGEIMFVGRKDSQIKHLGYRIELGEIEAAARTIPQIYNCCVLYNQERQEITLFYEGPQELPLRELRTALKQLLPEYMVPRKIHFLTALPLNPNGKIDRKALENEFF